MGLVRCPSSTAREPPAAGSRTERARSQGRHVPRAPPRGLAFLRSLPVAEHGVRAWPVFGIVPTLSGVHTGTFDPVAPLARGSGRGGLRGEARCPAWGHRLRVSSRFRGAPGPARCWTTGGAHPPPFQDTSRTRGACKAQSEMRAPAFTSCLEVPLICPSGSLDQAENRRPRCLWNIPEL